MQHWHHCAPARIVGKRPPTDAEKDRAVPDLSGDFASNDPEDMDALDGQNLDEHLELEKPEPDVAKAHQDGSFEKGGSIHPAPYVPLSQEPLLRRLPTC